MTRMILLLLASVAVGTLLGAVFAGATGGLFGTMLGALFGMAWLAGRKATWKAVPGAPVHHERHRLLCIATGQFADVELMHDEHHWCDVETCTLCRPANEVQCRKRCLELMNDNYPPGKELQTG